MYITKKGLCLISEDGKKGRMTEKRGVENEGKLRNCSATGGRYSECGLGGGRSRFVGISVMEVLNEFLSVC